MSVLSTQFEHFSKSAGATWTHPLAARVSMLDRQSLLSGNTALTGLGHWWWWVWVFLIIQYSSFTLQILKWLDTAVRGGGGAGGSSTWVTLLGNITFYNSCGVGGPNFESQNFSKSRYENFDEIASKYIYIYSICTILYDRKRNVAGAETKSRLSLGTSRFWASYTVAAPICPLPLPYVWWLVHTPRARINGCLSFNNVVSILFSVLFGLTFRPLIISGFMPYYRALDQLYILFVSSHARPAAVALTSSSFLSHRALCCLCFSVSYPLLLTVRSPFFCAPIVQIRLYYLVIFPTSGKLIF